MNKQLLIDVIVDQAKVVLPKRLVSRQIYSSLRQYTQSKQVIIISGIRRCGKSTLLQQLRTDQKEKDYYLNFDDDRLCRFSIDDFQMLLEVFIERYGAQSTYYFDEIQNIIGWERFVRRLQDGGATVYLTGSNATMLSKELGTRLTGRYIQIELFPFSFSEYMYFQSKEEAAVSSLTTERKAQIKRLFNAYLKEGGVPGYLTLRDKEYLHFLYESILYRDIIARYSLLKEKALKELVFFLASNLGKPMSYNSVRKMLGLGSPHTVSEYCGYLEDSFLVFFIPRYDVSVKKQIQYNKKSYFIDTAVAQAVGFRFSDDKGRMLENVVFLELKRRGLDIYYHKQKKECDFVIKKGKKIISAIQVAWHLDTEEIKKREFAGLQEAMDMYGLREGTILTEDTHGEELLISGRKRRKVHIVPVWKWLMP